MVSGGSRLDPRSFISAPRRSNTKANPDGTYALYNVPTHPLTTHSTKTGVYIIDLQTKSSTLVSEDPQAKDHAWTGDGCELVWRKQPADGATEIWVGDAKNHGDESYDVGRIEARMSILTVSRQSPLSFAILMLGPATLDNESDIAEQTIYSTGREYTSLPVRDFDHYVSSKSQTLWYLRFHKSSSGSTNHYSFSTAKPIKVLQNTNLRFVTHSGSIPLGPANCDLSPYGITFVGEQSGSRRPQCWTSDLFYVPLSNLLGDVQPRAQIITSPGFTGKCSRPTFSLDGKSIAFIRAKDQNKVLSRNYILVSRVFDAYTASPLIVCNAKGGPWSLSPESLIWSNDGDSIYFVAPECGRRKLFKTTGLSSLSRAITTCLTSEGSVSSFCPYSNSRDEERVLVSKTAFHDSSQFCVVDGASGVNTVLSSSLEYSQFGLSSEQVSEIWCPGAGDYRVHTWIVKPSFFEEGSSYPVAFFVHGGGTGAWTDSWSTRWNPMVVAEQGYGVVLPNISGSVGYDEDFQLSVLGDVGGRPYRDIEHCFSYITGNLAFADMNRAVLMGGSFGGFLAFWVAGQPLAKHFKAIVSHAGMFDVYNLYGSDIADSWRVAFGGYDTKPSHIKDIFDRWNPARFAENWTTPMLITHNDLDFRCPVSMSLAAFATLQLKGVESKFLNFPDEGHFVLKPENSLHWHCTVMDWINRFTAVAEVKT